MRNKIQPNWQDVLFCSGDIRTKALKIIDYYLGGLLCSILRPKPEDKNLGQVRNILVIRPGGIGDAVQLIPFLKEVKRLFPDAGLDILCQGRNREVFELAGALAREIFCFDTPGIISLLRRLQKKDYDIVIDSEQWHNFSAIISWITCRRQRIGFDTRPCRAKFYTELAPYARLGYEADIFLRLLDPFRARFRHSEPATVSMAGEESKYLDPSFAFGSFRMTAVASFQDGAAKKIALCLSASIPERRWPAAHFRQLIEYLLKNNYQVILLGAKIELKFKKNILQGLTQGSGVKDFVAKTNLRQTAELVAGSDIYIGQDTGILHLAYALGIPVVSLFGPGIKEKWAAGGAAKFKAISKDLPCSPCTLFGYTRSCRQPKCMELITVQDVITAVDTLSNLRG